MPAVLVRIGGRGSLHCGGSAPLAPVGNGGLAVSLRWLRVMNSFTRERATGNSNRNVGTLR